MNVNKAWVFLKLRALPGLLKSIQPSDHALDIQNKILFKRLNILFRFYFEELLYMLICKGAFIKIESLYSWGN